MLRCRTAAAARQVSSTRRCSAARRDGLAELAPKSPISACSDRRWRRAVQRRQTLCSSTLHQILCWESWLWSCWSVTLRPAPDPARQAAWPRAPRASASAARRPTPRPRPTRRCRRPACSPSSNRTRRPRAATTPSDAAGATRPPKPGSASLGPAQVLPRVLPSPRLRSTSIGRRGRPAPAR